MVRAKFVCNLKDMYNKTVYMSPVYSGSEENKEFFKYTPGGTVVMNCLNPVAFDKFEQGKEYYLDFTAA